MIAHSRFTAEITALHAACQDRLDSSLPTHLRRRDYHEALYLADAAVQLATEAVLETEVLATCEALQKRCEDVLRSWYDVLDQREKELYERAVAARSVGTEYVLGRYKSEPETKQSSVWWSSHVAVIGEEQSALLTPAERRLIIRDLRVRLSMATGIPYRSR